MALDPVTVLERRSLKDEDGESEHMYRYYVHYAECKVFSFEKANF
jgi:hypothetical protein